VQFSLSSRPILPIDTFLYPLRNKLPSFVAEFCWSGNMTKKKRNHNPNLIKEKHSYSFEEISEKLNVHIRTVQIWHKHGLNVIDEAKKPYLVYGVELKQFLKAKQQSQKHPLKTGEFFCTKCRCARKSRPENLTFEITRKKLGKTSKQALISGICEICSQPLLLFSSDRKVRELEMKGMLSAECKTTLYGNGDSSCNTDIERY
jgi:DNA-binding transcriptional MerR regulator